MDDQLGQPFGERKWVAQIEAGVMWWERMRLIYNAVVGITGLGVLSISGGIEPIISPLIWVFIFIYAFFANICYFLGPVIDIYTHVFFKDKLRFNELRVTLFVLGLVFSCAITGFLAAVIGSGL